MIQSAACASRAGHASALLLLLLLALTLPACRSLETPWGNLIVATGAPIRLGAAYDADAPESAHQPPDTAKPLPTIAGHPLTLVPIPVHCRSEDPSTVISNADLDGLVGFLGGACSRACVYSEPGLFDRRLTMLAFGCTSRAVVTQEFPIVFRLAWDDDDQGRVAADYAVANLGVRRVAVVRDTSVYARSVGGAFTSRFRDAGRTAVEVEVPSTGRIDPAVLVRRVRAARPEAVFVALGRPGARETFSELQSQLDPVPVIASDTALVADATRLSSADDGQAELPPPAGLIAVGLARIEGSWVSELDLGANNPRLFDAQRSDALGLYAAQLLRVGRSSPDNSFLISKKGLRDALSASEFDGLTGRISFDRRGERKSDVGAALYRVTAGGRPERLRLLPHGESGG